MKVLLGVTYNEKVTIDFWFCKDKGFNYCKFLMMLVKIQIHILFKECYMYAQFTSAQSLHSCYN